MNGRRPDPVEIITHENESLEIPLPEELLRDVYQAELRVQFDDDRVAVVRRIQDLVGSLLNVEFLNEGQS